MNENEDFELENEKSEKISLSVWKKILKLVLKSKKNTIVLMICLVFLAVIYNDLCYYRYFIYNSNLFVYKKSR